jgi:hypothetical protein
MALTPALFASAGEGGRRLPWLARGWWARRETSLCWDVPVVASTLFRKLDRLVYKFWTLTDEEIPLVEQATER